MAERAERGRRNRLLVASLAGALLLPLAACRPVPVPVKAPKGPAPRGPLPPGQVGFLAPNAGWCWWQSQRAVISDGTLLVGSVPHHSGTGGFTHRTQVLSMDLATTKTTVTDLATNPYVDDDHDSPGLVVNPDGSVTAAWTGHGNDGTMRFATSDATAHTSWTRRPDQVFEALPAIAQATYGNVLRSDGLLWNFTRRNNRNWAMWSDDDGETWSGGWLLFGGTLSGVNNASQRPYVHFVANPALDRIDFVTTAGHPKDLRGAALYSGYIKDFGVYRTDGTRLGTLGDGPGYAPTDLTEIARPPTTVNPDIAAPYDDADLWGSDLQVDATGHPVLTYSLRTPVAPGIGGKRFSHDYYWARWNGSAWVTSRLGNAGSELFAGEPDYTGLATLDPLDPYRVVASSNVNPLTGAPLVSTSDQQVHHELFEVVSSDAGATWTWRAITRNSVGDNLRPLMAADEDGRTALVWLRGTYRSWSNWNMQAMVILGTPPTTPLPVT